MKSHAPAVQVPITDTVTDTVTDAVTDAVTTEIFWGTGLPLFGFLLLIILLA
jgi:hypothetical protein